MRQYVNSALANPNMFYKVVLKILDDPVVVENIADVLLDSVLKVSLTSSIEKVKDACKNCHFAFSLITAVGKYDKGKYKSFSTGDVKENPVIQSVVSALHNVAAHKLEGQETIDCDVLVCGNKRKARQLVIELVEKLGMRGLHAGPIENSIATEAMTSVLITINRHYKVADAGFKITGNLVLTG